MVKDSVRNESGVQQDFCLPQLTPHRNHNVAIMENNHGKKT